MDTPSIRDEKEIAVEVQDEKRDPHNQQPLIPAGLVSQPHPQFSTPLRPYTILSIDGGGIRGIIPAKVLEALEKEIRVIEDKQHPDGIREEDRTRLYQLFDLIAGTSTGGILALGLTSPQPEKENKGLEPKTASDMLKFYREKGRIIFQREERSGTDKAIQHIGGVILAFTTLGLASLYTSFRIPFRSLKTPVINYATAVARNGLMTGSCGLAVQVALKKDASTSFWGFVRGGLIGGLALSVFNINGLFSQEKVSLKEGWWFPIVASTLQGLFVGLVDYGMKKRQQKKKAVSSAEIIKDIPASLVAGSAITIAGTNILPFKYELIGVGLGFTASWLVMSWVSKGHNYLFPKHSRVGIDKTLDENFSYDERRPILLKDTRTGILITSYNTDKAKTVLFTKEPPHGDLPISGIAGATSAAPTYFPPKELQFDVNTRNICIDGGLVANNPTLCAYAYVRRKNNERRILDEQMYIISLGTGVHKESFWRPDIEVRGILGWIKSIIEIQSQTGELTDTLMEYLFKVPRTQRKTEDDNYHRFQCGLLTNVELDGISDDNIKALETAGHDLVDAKKEEISEIAQKLMEFKAVRLAHPLPETPSQQAARNYRGNHPSGMGTQVARSNPVLSSAPAGNINQNNGRQPDTSNESSSNSFSAT